MVSTANEQISTELPKEVVSWLEEKAELNFSTVSTEISKILIDLYKIEGSKQAFE
jgi:hypothetical protein